MLWHELSWPEIARIDKNTPVVIPLGSCEQHGHHLPLFVDTIQVTAIAESAEKALRQNVLLLPTLWLGSSHHHMDFPGTVSVLPALYEQMIQSVALSILNAGFKRICFLNGHGGNRVPAGNALSHLVADNDSADDAYLALSNWWEVSRDAIRAEKHGMTTDAISHACEYETSLMLFLRPELVHLDRAREGKKAIDNSWHQSENDPRTRVAIYRRFHRLTAAGSMGKPSAATRDKGRSLHDAVVNQIVSFLRDFRQWPELPTLGPVAPT